MATSTRQAFFVLKLVMPRPLLMLMLVLLPAASLAAPRGPVRLLQHPPLAAEHYSHVGLEAKTWPGNGGADSGNGGADSGSGGADSLFSIFRESGPTWISRAAFCLFVNL